MFISKSHNENTFWTQIEIPSHSKEVMEFMTNDTHMPSNNNNHIMPFPWIKPYSHVHNTCTHTTHVLETTQRPRSPNIQIHFFIADLGRRRCHALLDQPQYNNPRYYPPRL